MNDHYYYLHKRSTPGHQDHLFRYSPVSYELQSPRELPRRNEPVYAHLDRASRKDCRPAWLDYNSKSLESLEDKLLDVEKHRHRALALLEEIEKTHESLHEAIRMRDRLLSLPTREIPELPVDVGKLIFETAVNNQYYRDTARRRTLSLVSKSVQQWTDAIWFPRWFSDSPMSRELLVHYRNPSERIQKVLARVESLELCDDALDIFLVILQHLTNLRNLSLLGHSRSWKREPCHWVHDTRRTTYGDLSSLRWLTCDPRYLQCHTQLQPLHTRQPDFLHPAYHNITFLFIDTGIWCSRADWQWEGIQFLTNLSHILLSTTPHYDNVQNVHSTVIIFNPSLPIRNWEKPVEALLRLAPESLKCIIVWVQKLTAHLVDQQPHWSQQGILVRPEGPPYRSDRVEYLDEDEEYTQRSSLALPRSSVKRSFRNVAQKSFWEESSDLLSELQRGNLSKLTEYTDGWQEQQRIADAEEQDNGSPDDYDDTYNYHDDYDHNSGDSW